MEAARWNRIEEILQGALDREPRERAAFLDDACAGDDGIRREVESLLAHEHDGAVLSAFPALAPIDAHLTGTKVSHYRIESRIGAGGMGEVYEAHDESLQRVVALKVLPGVFGGDPDRVRRFEQEALAASRLNHPNIVTIFEVLHSDGAHFIATEHVDGVTLREFLRDRKLNAGEALDIVIQIANALKAAHTAWIIHRDIKPENIMVRRDGLVKVVDFGIAKLSEEAEDATRIGSAPTSPSNLTIPGAVLGTASYMSPEQARGESLDGRTDLYSLGLVFHEMLTGQRALSARRSLPRDLDRIVRKLLRTNRDERYSSAGELLHDLHRAKQRLESRTSRRFVGISALAVLIALAAAGIAAVLSIDDQWEEHVLRDGHTAAARQAVFSPDGRTLVSCGEDGQVIVWDFARRQRIASLQHPSRKVAYAPNGRWVATGGVDGAVMIWDTATWRPLHRTPPNDGEVSALQFSPDSRFLAAIEGSTAALRRTSDWARVRQWSDQGSSHGTFLFSRTTSQLLLSCQHFTVLDESGAYPQGDRTIGLNWIALSPDGTRLAGVDTLGGVWFYRLRAPGDFRDPQLIADRLPGHRDHGRGAAWSPDGTLVATGADDIIIWDANTQQKVARFEYPSIVWSVTFSPDGQWLLSTHGDGAVLIWDVRERELVASLNEHSAGVRAVAFSPDGRLIASGSEDRTVTLWNADTGRKEAVLGGHATRVTGVAFSGDGYELASADQRSQVIMWDVARRALRTQFKQNDGESTYCLAFAPDGQTLITSPSIWKRSGQLIGDLTLQVRGQVYGAAWSRDGSRIATATSGGEVHLWDARTLAHIAKQEIPNTHQITISFSPDGEYLATGEDEGRVRLWSTNPLREIATLGRHAARIKAVAFSPNGDTVASAGDDKMIALWDVERRKLRTRIGTHASPIYALAFSPDGRRLVSGEHDRSVRVYTHHRYLWGMLLE